METILEVKNLVKYFSLPRNNKKVHSVDDISFSITKGETFGLAGESGCGKTTTGRLITGLVSPTSGTIDFLGKSIFNLNKRDNREYRRNIQTIFQDPFGSLNPRKTVGSILSLPFKIYKPATKSCIKKMVFNLLESVDLKPPDIYWDRYPHELSGGQKQRVSIGRSIAIHPQLIVADEAVAALDISVKAGILNLMRRLRDKSGVGYLFISHDLSVLRNMCDRIAIMYLGKFVELGDAEDIFVDTQHPYTRALLSAALIPDPRIELTRKRMILSGDVASAIDLPIGCRFNTRCPDARDKCYEVEPVLIEYKKGHMVACHLY